MKETLRINLFHLCPKMMDGALDALKQIIHFPSADAGAAPSPLSPVLRVAQPLAPLMSLTTPTPAPVASPAVASTASATAPETPSAAGGDERPSELNSPSEPDQEPEAEPEAESDAETEQEKARRLLYCSLCKVAVNSASQLEAHNSGKRRVLTFAANADLSVCGNYDGAICTEHKRPSYMCFPVKRKKTQNHWYEHNYSILCCAAAVKNTHHQC